MLQALVWQIVWVLIQYALGVSKEFVEAAIAAVIEAKDLRHEDGTFYTGAEKKDWVVNELVIKFNDYQFKKEWSSTVSSIVDLAWSFTKQKMEGDVTQ